jgi:hypothetical protein
VSAKSRAERFENLKFTQKRNSCEAEVKKRKPKAKYFTSGD